MVESSGRESGNDKEGRQTSGGDSQPSHLGTFLPLSGHFSLVNTKGLMDGRVDFSDSLLVLEFLEDTEAGLQPPKPQDGHSRVQRSVTSAKRQRSGHRKISTKISAPNISAPNISAPNIAHQKLVQMPFDLEDEGRKQIQTRSQRQKCAKPQLKSSTPLDREETKRALL